MMRTQSLSAFLCLGLVGCSSMTANRSTLLTQKPRTVVSAGDTAVALRDGTGRQSIDTDLDEPEPPSRPDGRISGKVVDERGKAVPNAEVRLADGGLRSGRDQTVTTDATGRFTLRNLRPGGSYTLVAEGSEGKGGRAEDAEPGTPVTIRLGDDDGPKPKTADASDPARPGKRTNRVSERAPIREADADPFPEAEPPAAKRRINRDDLPPAEEAELIGNSAPVRAAWRKGATSDPAVSTVEADASPPPRTIAIKPAAIEPDTPAPRPVADDGPNPLPPAKERPRPAEPAPVAAPDAKPAEPNPSNELPPADKPAPASPGEPSPPANSSALPEPPANPFSSGENPTPAPSGSTALRAENEPHKTATWGELAAMESSTRATANPSTHLSTRRLPDRTPEARIAQEATQNRARTGLIERLTNGRSGTPETVVPASCQFDGKRQRIVDFRLPDLDGNPTRFQELDADFVLIDFWGTWCEPCMKSIPHLVELQERYGDKKLRVLGIAAARSPNFEQESRAVREAAAKLGINYSVLLSEADGKDCPLQGALHIQAYPTMILVDRSGQILWRAKGAEVATLNRLDKVLAARVDGEIVRR